jgi:hypothetical protein
MTSTTTNNPPDNSQRPLSWRSVLQIHSAANIDSLMPEAELRALGEDILSGGLQYPITLYDNKLLDGRNRLDALELVGVNLVLRDASEASPHFDLARALERAGIACITIVERCYTIGDVDPWTYAASANHHRRHMTPEEKRDAVADLLKASQPEQRRKAIAVLLVENDKAGISQSDRQIAEQTESNRNTVARIRAELADAGLLSRQSDSRIDKRGSRRRLTGAPKRKDPHVEAAVERAIARSEAQQAEQAQQRASDPPIPANALPTGDPAIAPADQAAGTKLPPVPVAEPTPSLEAPALPLEPVGEFSAELTGILRQGLALIGTGQAFLAIQELSKLSRSLADSGLTPADIAICIRPPAHPRSDN